AKGFAREGLTPVHHEGGALGAIRDIRARGDLRHRISYESGSADSLITQGIKTGDGDDWIKYGATPEHTVDGSFSERTMAMSEPYKGIDPPYKGNVTESQD